MISPNQKNAEWLETDGLGGFASGTVSGIRSRRYHALLLAATDPPSGRMVLVNGFDAWVETDSGSYPITSQKYAPDVIHPDGIERLEDFQSEPWPRWSFLLEDGRRIEQEIFIQHNSPVVVVIWRLIGNRNGASLRVRPFLSGRDYHSLHHENPDFHFEADINGERVAWRPYEGVPEITAFANGTYIHEPLWYRNFLYTEEQSRGLDFTEDLASPGTFRFDLSSGPAILLFTIESDHDRYPDLESDVEGLQKQELQRRNKLLGRLDRAADSYIVKRQQGKTIIAGYPWFTDWGRDTLIALRGLAISTGRLKTAEQILSEWAGTISEGMLPNRFPDSGSEPEFNSVDASLWFIIALHDFFKAAKSMRYRINDRKRMQQAADAILTGYREGTRYQIHMDSDCLIAAGQSGVQLTWMDAKVGDWVVTPRIGKPVEIQALWLNALRIASEWTPDWMVLYQQGCENFRNRFWNLDGSFLNDVVDVDHTPGRIDSSFRPNQIFAVGGLPFSILNGEQARKVVETVESRLLTPLGLRSLAPGEFGYTPHYEGGVRERDSAYHQGTVWPWLIGAFVEAWIRVRGNTNNAKKEARMRFLSPLLEHLDQAGLGHVSEIADGDSPHTPRGCPFQAWSVGEVLRLMTNVLVEEKVPIEKDLKQVST
ncbi:amylo-alpha-1,6-glucosidase [bacterium]|nr:amylo-alpha-1,6-glucosidase [bacterium]